MILSLTKKHKWIITTSLQALGLTALAAFGLSGCASNLFISYPSHMQKPLDLAKNNDMKAAANAASKLSGDTELKAPEVGRFQQLGGQYQASLTSYQAAIKAVQKRQLAAKVRVSRVAANTGSLLTNDNLIPYQLAGYETLMLYQYQALNYLGLGDLSNALVSIRRMGLEQTWIKQQHYKSLVKAQNEARKKHVDIQTKQYAKQLAPMLNMAAKIKSAFEIAYGYYFASIVYEASGDLNDALVSIKNAYQVAPQNPYVQQKLLQLLKQSGDSSSLAEYQKQMKATLPAPSPNAAQLVVLFEQGFVSAKQAVDLPIPLIGAGQFQTVSFPTYRTSSFQPTPLSISLASGKNLGNTEILTKMNPLAAKALSEQFPMIIFRAILRVAAKAVMTAQAENKGGDIAGLASQIYSLVSSQADLRSWLTLPNNAQNFQVYLKPGTYQLKLSSHGLKNTTKIVLKPKQTFILWVTEIGGRLTVRPLPL